MLEARVRADIGLTPPDARDVPAATVILGNAKSRVLTQAV